MTLAPLTEDHMPTRTRVLHKAVLYSTLTTNQRNHYAHTLAQAIHQHNGIPNCEPQNPTGETPPFRIVGAHQHTRPRALDTLTNELPKHHVPPARITIGGYEYDQAISSILPELHRPWHDWLRTRHAPSLVRHQDRRILLDDANWNAAARAALWVLTFAWVDLIE